MSSVEGLMDLPCSRNVKGHSAKAARRETTCPMMTASFRLTASKQKTKAAASRPTRATATN